MKLLQPLGAGVVKSKQVPHRRSSMVRQTHGERRVKAERMNDERCAIDLRIRECLENAC